MIEKQWLKLIIFIPLILIMFTYFLFIPYKDALVITYQNTNKVLAYIPFETKNQKFEMKYTHSIHLSNVLESYKVTKDQQIKQYELMFEDFAIGMPANAGEGEQFIEKDGKYYIKNMNRIFSLFDLRTGKVRANHTLIYQGREYPLSHFIQPGTWIRIKVNKLNFRQQLEGVNILGTE